jgi:hypothetical protein
MVGTKRISCQYIASAILALLLVSCSTANIIDRGEFIEENSIKKGTPRVDILSSFGSPVDAIENDEGNKVDLFRVEQGYKKSSKVLIGTGTFCLRLEHMSCQNTLLLPKQSKRMQLSLKYYMIKMNELIRLNLFNCQNRRALALPRMLAK